MLGQKIKQLRTELGISQRELGAHIEVDSAFISKVEKGEKPIKREHLKVLSEVLKIDEVELQKLWLANKIYKIVADEELAIEALELAEQKVEYLKKSCHGKE
jgi:transcriptional regulator with XRE-family HTH domain